MKPFLLLVLCFLASADSGFARGQVQYVETTHTSGSFSIVRNGAAAPIQVDAPDWPGVARAAGDLRDDIARVTGCTPTIWRDATKLPANVIIVGTVGRSATIGQLIRDRKLDVTGVSGKWESFVTQVVPAPFPGVASALVIAGSDKRGTIYGIYDLSEQMGVSPWYWWADVPVPHSNELFVKAGRYVQGEPAVRYRGIFLNDEAPALTGWVKEKYGAYNHEFYSRVFELLLRLKGNYLWPAMWDNAFNEDDPLNSKLADEYGIVMGTSHHEPMLRAQQEWKRHGTGPWNYSTNSDVLRAFWEQGIERNKNYESIVTLGMRGDGDMPMSQTANIELLEKIVADQRKIIAQRMNPDVTKVPQDWALYKEVQEYYEKGMRVPDDVTLLWCDDNWGNIRRLPTAEERKRSGGAGIYYHFDYVGGPRSYKWLNTIPLTKIQEQMNLAWRYGADRIWIVNVGDLKPMELPIDFFLNMAWDPRRWTKDTVGEFTRKWAEQQFGPQYAGQIAHLLAAYTKFNGRRKPELLEPDTYSLTNYREADRVLAEWKGIVAEAEQIQKKLPENAQDAFFQLVLYPAKASATVAELYIAVGKNRLYASQGRASANGYAAQARDLFHADAELATYYNHTMARGKWNHMMDQTHIGYTSWRDPPVNVMPEVKEVPISSGAQLGVAPEGSTLAWPGAEGQPALPAFDRFGRQSRFIDVFNRGRVPFRFAAVASDPWIVVTPASGLVEKDDRVHVSVEWARAPREASQGSVTISGAGSSPVTVIVRVLNRPVSSTGSSFVEGDGAVSIEAEHYTRKSDSGSTAWEKMDDFGRTLSAMNVFPATAPSAAPPENSPHLDYAMYLFDAGKVTVQAILAPTLNFVPGRGLRFAISWDDQPPRTIDALARNSLHDWEETVKDGVRKVDSEWTLDRPGWHTLRFWMVDPGVVLEKLVVDLGGVKPSYLGPPESYRSPRPRGSG